MIYRAGSSEPALFLEMIMIIRVTFAGLTHDYNSFEKAQKYLAACYENGFPVTVELIKVHGKIKSK